MTSILAIRVPEDWATLEAITNLFSTYGNITLARVLRPGRPIPPDLRNYATQIPDMGATTCAVVALNRPPYPKVHRVLPSAVFHHLLKPIKMV